ncbi:MAG: hypothetical protein Q8N22_01615 [bacterium]|nr:hypothetical protein [bacterium]
MQFNKKLALRVIVLIVGLALIISGVIKIVGGLKDTKDSNTINKFNEIYALGGQIGEEMKITGALLNGISGKEQAKDYAGAVKDISTAISDIDNVISEFNVLNIKISEFKKILGDDPDQAVKQSGLKLVDLLEQRNIASLDLINNTKQFVVLSKTYYEELAAGKTEVKIDEIQANSFIQKITQADKTLLVLTPQVNTATQDFAKIANFQLKTK